MGSKVCKVMDKGETLARVVLPDQGHVVFNYNPSTGNGVLLAHGIA